MHIVAHTVFIRLFYRVTLGFWRDNWKQDAYQLNSRNAQFEWQDDIFLPAEPNALSNQGSGDSRQLAEDSSCSVRRIDNFWALVCPFKKFWHD